MWPGPMPTSVSRLVASWSIQPFGHNAPTLQIDRTDNGPTTHLQTVAQKCLNGSICRLSCGLGCSEGSTLASRGEYDWTVRLPRRCGLTSKFFDHLLRILSRGADCAHRHRRAVELLHTWSFSTGEGRSRDYGAGKAGFDTVFLTPCWNNVCDMWNNVYMIVKSHLSAYVNYHVRYTFYNFQIMIT